MARVVESIARAMAEKFDGPLFGLMGDGNIDLVTVWADVLGRPIVQARHEQYAVAMADGYFRFSGKPGLCSVTQGPGLTNTATSLVTARHHRSSVLLHAGQSSLGDVHNPQRFDQNTFATATAGAGLQVESQQMVRPALDAAFRYIDSGQGPFVFSLPQDIQSLAQPESWIYEPPPVPSIHAAESDSIEHAADILVGADRPVILAGNGAVHANAAAAIASLSSHLGAPIVTSLLAKGLVRDHPNQAGVSGGMGNKRATRLLEEADVLLVLGASLNQWTAELSGPRQRRRIIQVDRDPHNFGRQVRPILALEGDARLTTALICQAVERRCEGKLRAPYAEAGPMSSLGPYFDATNGDVDPRRAVDCLNAALPRDRLVVADGGHCVIAICQHLAVCHPRNWTYSFDFGCIGQGLALALGGCFARPGRRVTLVTGDASLMMGLAELDTAVRYRLPLTVIVLNDGGFGQERHSLRRKGFRPSLADLPPPNFAGIASAVGGHGENFHGQSGLSQLASRLGEIEHRSGLFLADVPINGAVELSASAEIARRLKGMDESASH